MTCKTPKYLIWRIPFVMIAVNGKLRTIMPIPRQEIIQDWVWKFKYKNTKRHEKIAFKASLIAVAISSSIVITKPSILI